MLEEPMNRTVFLLGAFLCLGVPGSLTFGQDLKDVTGSGAVVASGEYMRVTGTVGQTTIGMINGQGSVAWLGFWNSPRRMLSGADLRELSSDAALNLAVQPNPVSDRTTFAFTMAERNIASLILYNNLGQSVRVIAASEFESGPVTVECDLKDLPSGRYTAVLRTDRQQETIPLHIVE